MLINLWGHVSYFLKDFSFFLFLLLIFSAGGICLTWIIYKSPISEIIKKIGIVLIFTLVAFVYVYSGFEAYFRYRFDQSDSLGFLRVTQRWNQRHVVYNNYQYRDKNFTVDKPPGTVRIGVMGDSNTFGYGIKNVSDRFSDQLEAALNKNGYKAQVYNFGVPGFDTEQEVNEYKRVEPFNFDIVVWAYFLNDIEEASRSAGGAVLRGAQAEPPGILRFLIDKSYFFDYVYWRLDARYSKTFEGVRNADLSQYNNREIFNHHTSLIDGFTSSIESQGKKIVALVMPFFYFFPNYPQNAIDIHKKMDGVFTSDGVSSVVDVLDYVKGKKSKDLVVGPYDSHPNVYVHHLIAQKLYDAITPLLIKTSDGQTIVKQ